MNLDNLNANIGEGKRVSDTVDVRKLLAINLRLKHELAAARAEKCPDMAAVTWAYVKLLKMDFGPNDADAVVMMERLKQQMIENMPKESK